MSKAAIMRILVVHQAAIERHEESSTRATICAVLAELVAEKITEGQALTMLALMAERVSASTPDQVGVYRATIDALHQMQADEH